MSEVSGVSEQVSAVSERASEQTSERVNDIYCHMRRFGHIRLPRCCVIVKSLDVALRHDRGRI